MVLFRPPPTAELHRTRVQGASADPRPPGGTRRRGAAAAPRRPRRRGATRPRRLLVWAVFGSWDHWHWHWQSTQVSDHTVAHLTYFMFSDLGRVLLLAAYPRVIRWQESDVNHIYTYIYMVTHLPWQVHVQWIMNVVVNRCLSTMRLFEGRAALFAEINSSWLYVTCIAAWGPEELMHCGGFPEEGFGNGNCWQELGMCQCHRSVLAGFAFVGVF